MTPRNEYYGLGTQPNPGWAAWGGVVQVEGPAGKGVEPAEWEVTMAMVFYLNHEKESTWTQLVGFCGH